MVKPSAEALIPTDSSVAAATAAKMRREQPSSNDFMAAIFVNTIVGTIRVVAVKEYDVLATV